MVNIVLTPQQAEELKSFYVIELEKIQKRADEIKGILNKLTVQPELIKTPATKQVKEKTEKKISLKNQKEITLHKETEKNTPQWGSFIIQVLQEKQKPLSRQGIAKLYEQHYNTKITNYKNIMNTIAQALYWLRVKNKKIVSIQKAGVKGKLYGLAEWGANPVNKTVTAKIPKAKKNKQSQRKQKTIVKPDNKPPINSTYNWPEFIKETLNKQKRILNAKELLQYAMKHFELPAHEMISTRGKLSPALSRLHEGITLCCSQRG
jgi:hypothetical protein